MKIPETVSVEMNGEIRKITNFQSKPLEEGDKVAFLYFMGGGSGTHRTAN